MNQRLTEEKSIYLQISQMIETDILRGILQEEERVPSTNELAKLYTINPATAAKGINLLVEAGILYKKRGIGMFVQSGATEKIRARRKEEFYRVQLQELLEEAAAQYGVDISQLRPRAVDRHLLESYDVALCMTEEQGDSLAERWPEFDERIICLGESDIRVPKFETQGAWNRLAERIAEEVRFLMDELMGDTGDDDDT